MLLPRRKITYRLYPNKKQTEALHMVSKLHRDLYNAALHQRIEAYNKKKHTLSFYDQCKELTQLREECEEYGELNAQSCQVTLKRVDLAFQHFFRRVKEGAKKCGFPRFKSVNRFKGFGYKTHGDGFKLISEGKHGAVRLSGIGQVKMRGKARTWGEVVTAEVIKKGENWYLSVTVACQPKRTAGKMAGAFDWGVETFATIALSDGTFEKVENPRFLRKSLKKLAAEQRALSKKKPGSKNRNRARKRMAKTHQKVANQRKNFAHQQSAAMVKNLSLIGSEELDIKNMTASGGSYKKGLNREILNTAPALFISCLKYKAEEAGTQWRDIPTRKVKPSQTCSGCGHTEKKLLSERVHLCKGCHLTLGRDENSARVILNWALTGRASG
jgi:putative transposase